MSDYTITVPWPDACLFANRSNGRHWSLRQDAKRTARAVAGFESIGHHVGSNITPHHVSIYAYPPDKRSRDVDGILSALKPTLDGLADGLQINDFNFNPITIQRCDPVEGGKVTIVVHDDLPFGEM